MAYNTTSWTPDNNTKAEADTTNSKFHIYKSITGGFDGWSGNNTTNIIFLNYGDRTESSTPAGGNCHTFVTGGNLVKIYYVASEADFSGKTVTIKAYRYRPDGSTNTGNMDIIGNWTELETGTLTPQVADRGVVVNFTEATCAFAAGDLMCISMLSNTNAGDENTRFNYNIVLKEDWNDIISSNV